MVLAGTFGELRTNHFHAGIDIKTQGVEGKEVHAAKEGFVSRIKVSTSGYGKALYITHPNGYTTVYGHLKKFNDRIEAYIKKRQYQDKKFEIQVFPLKNELPIATNEVIAFSGNTGGSGGPHLHFEIRDSKTEHIINPLLFGYDVPDTRHPKVLGIRMHPIGSTSGVNKLSVSQEIPLHKINNNTYVAKSVKAVGKIGISVRTYDLLNGAFNKNGVYSIATYVNDSLIYHHRLETFSFSESKYINLLIDYPYYAEKKRKYQKTYVDPANKLSIYKTAINKGFLTVKPLQKYNLKIAIKDVANNTTTIKIPVIGDPEIVPVFKDEKQTPYFINHQTTTIFKEKNVEITFPKHALFHSTYIDFKVSNNGFRVHKPTLPFNHSYTISYAMDSVPKTQKKYAYLASINSSGTPYYLSSYKKGNQLIAKTKTLGDFTIAYDSIAPKIYQLNFYENQNLANHKHISVKIKDDETGIKSYYATVDNRWILMEYEPKKNELFFDLNDLETTNKKHIFQLKIEDLLGNTKTLQINFIK